MVVDYLPIVGRYRYPPCAKGILYPVQGFSFVLIKIKEIEGGKTVDLDLLCWIAAVY